MIEIIDARGNKKSYESLNNMTFNTNFGIQKALYKSGKDLEETFNQQVLDKGAKTGRIYIIRDRLGRGRRHQASAPGESPANRTGFYRRSIGFKVDGSNQLIFGNSAKYALFLEVGTSRMKKRPGLGNAVKSNERNIIKNLSGEINESI